jgi:beta-mannosidase
MRAAPPDPAEKMPSTSPPAALGLTRHHAIAWQLGHAADAGQAPSERVPAAVPGAVQLDWARAHDWPPWWHGESPLAYLWMEDVFWTYRATLDFAPPAPGERLFLVCGGCDYACTVRLAGAVVLEHEGMLSSWEIDLTGRAQPGSVLEIVVHPAPKSQRATADRTQANRCCKPPVCYLWDFHPRLIPLGLWQPTFLEIRPAAHLREVHLDYVLSEDLTQAGLALEVAATAEAARLRVRACLTAPDGVEVWNNEFVLESTEARRTGQFAHPALWWPHDHGTPALHVLRVELCDTAGRVLDRREQRVGFRRVRLVMAPGQWDEPVGFPMSRSHPPMTLEINGRRLFAKGANWVGPHIFPGALTADDYTALLRLAHDSHFNLLRAWGGAATPHDWFFELCDALGIMVWQEFPLACNVYPDEPAYLGVLDQESRALLRRLRGHACVVMWCGGNELFNRWSGMTDQSLALRLLDKNCYELAPRTPFLPTSPLDGVGHGHYVFRDPQSGQEAWSMFQHARATAYCEFGVPAPASVEILREIIPAGELWPPRPDGSWAMHHAATAWQATSHLYPQIIEHYFGPSPDLETLVARGQLLQCEGHKGLYEEARRQQPRASMALAWCFNEPWPTAANLSLVSWPARPKPGLAAVAASCRPALASARVAKFSWKPGEVFAAELWILNDAPAPVPAGDLVARLVFGDRELPLLVWPFAGVSAQTNLRGPCAQVVLPAAPAGLFRLELRVRGRPELDSEYQFMLVGAPGIAAAPPHGAAVLNQ